MSKALIFWILMLIWLVLGLFSNWSTFRSSAGGRDWKPLGNHIFLFFLFLLLGWAQFGAPVHE